MYQQWSMVLLPTIICLQVHSWAGMQELAFFYMKLMCDELRALSFVLLFNICVICLWRSHENSLNELVTSTTVSNLISLSSYYVMLLEYAYIFSHSLKFELQKSPPNVSIFTSYRRQEAKTIELLVEDPRETWNSIWKLQIHQKVSTTCTLFVSLSIRSVVTKLKSNAKALMMYITKSY